LGGDLVAENVLLKVNGSSTVRLSGSSENLRLEGCGNSMADLSAFDVIDAEINMACSSTAIVDVDNRLDVEAAQSSRVFYINWPRSTDINTHANAYVGRK
jgi:hypothetical protein